jgi:pimeloyl-ACP methyl ester carboxylesterase
MKVPYPIRFWPPAAERVWFTPPRPNSATLMRDRRDLASFSPISVEVRDRSRPGYSRGEGPLVILAHGWGGRAAQMKDLATPIAAAGFTTVAIDAPGHGTDTQTTSNAFEMAEAAEALARRFGPPAAIVGHSLGAMAAVLASFQQPPKAAVFVAPILDIRQALLPFATQAQLASWTVHSLERRLRRFAGSRWGEITVGPKADIPGASILVVHDPDDGEAPFANSADLSASRPQTRLVASPGLGHYRILKDPTVGELVTGFLSSALTWPGVLSD